MSGRFKALPPAADVLVTATSIQAGRWHVPDSREALIMLLGMVIPGAQRQGQARLTREAGWALCP